MLLVMGIGAALAALWGRQRRAVAATLLSLGLIWTLYGLVGYPLLNDTSSARGLMHRIAGRIGPDAELGLVAWKEQLLLRADRPAHTFGFRRPWTEQMRAAIRWQTHAPDSRWVLVRRQALGPCIQRHLAQRVGYANRRDWWLFQADAVQPTCRPTLAAPPPSDQTVAH
jgi:hypothetical protein